MIHFLLRSVNGVEKEFHKSTDIPNVFNKFLGDMHALKKKTNTI